MARQNAPCDPFQKPHVHRSFHKNTRIFHGVRRIHRDNIAQPAAICFFAGVAMTGKPDQNALVLLSANIRDQPIQFSAQGCASGIFHQLNLPPQNGQRLCHVPGIFDRIGQAGPSPGRFILRATHHQRMASRIQRQRSLPSIRHLSRHCYPAHRAILGSGIRGGSQKHQTEQQCQDAAIAAGKSTGNCYSIIGHNDSFSYPGMNA